jgi:hypothetical protein
MARGGVMATNPARGIRLQPADNVAITTDETAAGRTLDAGGELVTVRQDIPRGHKVALVGMAAGDPVRRYGQIIGFAGTDIAAGDHVHVHNVEYREFERRTTSRGPLARNRSWPRPTGPRSRDTCARTARPAPATTSAS